MLIGKNRVIRRRVVIGLLLAASLTLLTLSFRQGSGGVIGAAQRGVLTVTAPASEVAHRVTQPVVDAWNWATGLIDARDENDRLHAQLKQAAAEGVQVQIAQDEIEKLRQLLRYATSIDAGSFTTIGAAVIAQSPTDYRRTIVINVGSADGIAVDDAVVAPYKDGGGLVGRVIEVTSDAATVRLIVDPDSAVTAGVLSGTAKGTLVVSPGDPGVLSMLMVGADEVVAIGDTLITSGYGRAFEPLLPRGIPIGRVSSVGQSDADTDKTIQVTPFVDFQDMTDVLVLRPAGR